MKVCYRYRSECGTTRQDAHGKFGAGRGGVFGSGACGRTLALRRTPPEGGAVPRRDGGSVERCR
eukprot:16345170-Heterocapsa_arctica.AAC.1